MRNYDQSPSGRSLTRREVPDEATVGRYTSLQLGLRNPDPAHPVLLVFDNSLSTLGNGGLDQQNGLQKQLSDELRNERAIASSVLVATAGFGRTKPFELTTPFTPADQLKLTPLVAETMTPHCQRLIMAVDFMVKARDILSTQFEREVRTSWIFDWTDGQATDIEQVAAAIEASTVTAIRENIHIFYFGIGSDCDLGYLQQLAQPGRPPIHVRGVESFRRFFEWLTVSLNMYRCSRPGQTVELPSFGDAPRLITEG